jgi:hypothetical protein
MFPVKNGLNQGDALLPLLSNVGLGYAIRRVEDNQESWKLNGTYQLLVYANDVDTLVGNIYFSKKNTEALVVAKSSLAWM